MPGTSPGMTRMREVYPPPALAGETPNTIGLFEIDGQRQGYKIGLRGFSGIETAGRQENEIGIVVGGRRGRRLVAGGAGLRPRRQDRYFERPVRRLRRLRRQVVL